MIGPLVPPEAGKGSDMAKYGVKLSDGFETTIESDSWLKAGALVAIRRSEETGKATLVADVWAEGPCDDILVVPLPKAKGA